MNLPATIQVTESDIEAGVPRSASECPVALAMNRTFPGTRTNASRLALMIGSYLVAPPPDMVRLFIVSFDRNGTGTPFEFMID